jgi:hypothetical protein
MASRWGGGCSSAQRERSVQRQPELLLLLPAGAAARPGKEMSRKCSGYRITWL